MFHPGFVCQKKLAQTFAKVRVLLLLLIFTLFLVVVIEIDGVRGVQQEQTKKAKKVNDSLLFSLEFVLQQKIGIYFPFAIPELVEPGVSAF